MVSLCALYVEPTPQLDAETSAVLGAVVGHVGAATAGMVHAGSANSVLVAEMITPLNGKHLCFPSLAGRNTQSSLRWTSCHPTKVLAPSGVLSVRALMRLPD